MEPEIPPPITRQSTDLVAPSDVDGLCVMDWRGGAKARVVVSVLRSTRRGGRGVMVVANYP